MNIGIVTTWFERGAAYVSRQYKDVLERQGGRVFIYARGGEKYAEGDPVWDTPEVTWARKSAHAHATAIDGDDFKNWLHQNNIQLVLFNEQQWWPAILLARAEGVLTVAYVDYYKENTLPLFEAYDALLCNTRRHLSVFTWHKQHRYIPWGTDLSLFTPKKKKRSAHRDVVFFHSAGMNPLRKGTDLVIQAFMAVRGSARLSLHFQESSHLLSGHVRSDIRTLQQAGKLDMHLGDVTAPGLYGVGDVYVYPSRLEGIGLTQAEALACGLPLIVPDWPPMNEFIGAENGRGVPVDHIWSRADGYYWPQCRAHLPALTEAMQYYVDHAQRMDEYAAAARSYAEQHLDWRENAAGLLDFLAGLKRLPCSKEVVHRIMAEY